jgi:hypothetical protein
MKTTLLFSYNQIMQILKLAEAGTPVPTLRREHGMSSCDILQMTYQVWRHGCIYDGLAQGAGRRESSA